jgi:hypothetical protein
VTAQGEEVEFRAWLLEQIDAKRDELQAQVDQDPKEDRERNP